MAESSSKSVPARLGRYAIVRRLGAGGMAEVFLARSRGAEGTDKLLVVKRILPQYATNGRFRAMFVDEARVALRLNHPNIVQVYGFESDGPSLLLVMEHIDGVDLAHLARAAHARGERLPPGLCAWIVREIARGLHYAHERRDEDGQPLEIVHRDVSSSNVLLSYDGAVKLGDFGIARARMSSGDDDLSIKGKFAYMSPEQARLEAVDRRADVYGLGIVLGELSAGRSLHEPGVAGSEILARVRRGETPDLEAAGVPEGLRAVVASMIAADRAGRLPRAREVVEALTRYLRELEEEWDSARLEAHLGRYFTRVPAAEPAVEPEREELPRQEATTVVVGRRTRPNPVERPTGLTLAGEIGMVRERAHVAVLVGRFVIPSESEETVDSRAFFDLVGSLAFKADATLERAADDGRFTLVVGVLRPAVDYSLTAAQLALDLADVVRSLAADADAAPRLALGLARGVAASARRGRETLLVFDLVDESAALAGALADAAEPGEVLVTGGIYRGVRRAFVLGEASARTAGVSRSWRLERAKSRAEREADIDASTVQLVGREPELGRLRECVARVNASGRGESLLVTGELGVGKSALLAAFAAEHEANVGPSARVSVGFGQGERSFGAIAQLALGVLAISEDDADNGSVVDATVARALGAAGLGSGAAARAARRALRVVLGREAAEEADIGALARELAIILRRLLSAAAALAPLVAIVDGVDQTDEGSRATLLELARKPPSGRVLFVLGVRDGDPLCGECDGVSELPVAPLGLPQRERLLCTRLGVDHVGDELLSEVSGVAGGSPLMILEVLEALSDRGRIEVISDKDGGRVRLLPAREGEAPLPATLEEVLAGRIDSLPSEARSLARWCALIDREIPTDVLESLAGDEAPRAIGRLLADGILVRTRGQVEALTFSHAAFARVARASIDPTQMVVMHARIAAVLERRAASRGVGAAMVARHREAAGALRPAARAWLESAGALRAAGRYREAYEHAGRVLALTEGATDAEAFSLRFSAHGGREDVDRLGGRTRARRASLLALRQVAVDSREPRLIARALARQARYKLDTGFGDHIERDVLAATRAARRAGDARAEAEAYRVLALDLGKRGRYGEALVAADRALTALETRLAAQPPPGGTAEDGIRAARTLRVEVLLAQGALFRQTGEIDRAIEVDAEAYALVTRFGPRRLLAQVLNALGVAAYSRGDSEDALVLYRACIAAQRETGQRDRLGVALSNAGQAYAALGRGDLAAAYLRKALEVYGSMGARGSGVADAHVALAEVYADRGETDAALAQLEVASRDANHSGSQYDAVRVLLGGALVALVRGDFASARERAEGAERLAIEAGIAQYALHARAFAAEAAARMGDRGAALFHADRVLEDPAMVEPWRIERGDRVLSSVERAFAAIDEPGRAALVRGLGRRKKSAGDANPS
jgi:serine/threonine protein kinase/tetratricopeptide (TPR) repeat protein